MTKAELIARVAKKTKSSQVATTNILNATIEEITAVMKKKDSITFTGFGSFLVSKRARRKGRNPQTGADMTIAASYVPKFRAGKGLKEAVAGTKKK